MTSSFFWASNCRCCTMHMTVAPILLTPYAVLGHPAASCFPSFARLKTVQAHFHVNLHERGNRGKLQLSYLKTTCRKQQNDHLKHRNHWQKLFFKWQYLNIQDHDLGLQEMLSSIWASLEYGFEIFCLFSFFLYSTSSGREVQFKKQKQSWLVSFVLFW